MGILYFLILLFIIRLLFIWLFSPDNMENRVGYSASVADIWRIVKICQTSNFGKPSLTIKPEGQSVEIFLRFANSEKAFLSLPLILIKQKDSRDKYLKLFAEHDLMTHQTEKHITVYLDRTQDTLGALVADFYKEIIGAQDMDTFKFSVKAATSDLNALDVFKYEHLKINPDHKFEAPTARYKGKSVPEIQMNRVLNAFSWLLFAPIIILTYTSFGLMTMCCSALIFFAFFTAYRVLYQKEPFIENWGGGVQCLFLTTTLVTHDTNYLQSIPSIIGILTAVLSGALLFGILKPNSDFDIQQKQNKPKEFSLYKGLWVLGGLGLFLANEWAKRKFGIEGWVWFYGFMRLELMIAITAVFVPIYAIFFLGKENNDEG